GGLGAKQADDFATLTDPYSKARAWRLRSETRMERKSLKTNKPRKRRNENEVNPLKRNDPAKSLIRCL
ncbi:MAG TPA: hypothetical protein VI256_03620, partial [Roseiarcus sp.]